MQDNPLVLAPLEMFPQLATWRRSLLDLVYPPACAACDTPLAQRGRRFCNWCESQIARFDGPWCQRCGVTLPELAATDRECSHCRGERWRFDHVVALGIYEGLLRHLILGAKHPWGDATARHLADGLWELRGDDLRQRPIDVVCPVPMHWRHRLWKQTNSAETLAQRLAAHMGKPYRQRLVRKRHPTTKQALLPRTERLTNLRGSFVARLGRKYQQCHVLLVDDVLTTGATCSEAAKVLKRAGAADVTVAVIARSLKGR